MLKRSNLLVMSACLALAACAELGSGRHPNPAAPGTSANQVQQADRKTSQTGYAAPYTPGGSTWAARRFSALRVCRRQYSTCITADQQANPGQPGQLVGGSPNGRALCSARYENCLRLWGIESTPSPIR